MVCDRFEKSFVPFALAILIIHSSSECHRPALTSVADLFSKVSAMCFHVYVVMHVKDPYPLISVKQ